MLLAFLPIAFISQLALDFKGSTALRWRELRETYDRYSGLELAASLGAFSPQDEIFSAGIEGSTFERRTSSDPKFVSLSSDSSSRTIGISQAFIRYRYINTLSVGIIAGKFVQPYPLSPLIAGHVWNPEGIIEAISWNYESANSFFTFIAGQHPLLQSPGSDLEGTNLTRKWLFRQGALLKIDITDLVLKFSIDHIYLSSVPENLKSSSAARGNSFVGSLATPQLTEKFSTTEISAKIEASPLGLLTSIQGAFAINWRSTNKHRGYFIEGSVGNAWVKNNLIGTLGYYYAEPNLTLAALSDYRYGFANRESFRSAISYFPFQNIEGEFSFLYSKTIATSPVQGTRKEALITWKIRF